jgi:parallel beta-helix repeat protein
MPVIAGRSFYPVLYIIYSTIKQFINNAYLTLPMEKQVKFLLVVTIIAISIFGLIAFSQMSGYATFGRITFFKNLFTKAAPVPTAAPASSSTSISGNQVAIESMDVNFCRDLNDSNTEYNLSQDISSTGRTCFNVTANNVTLDCQGHSITGNQTGDGIYNVLYINVAVKNCKIYNFSTGIYWAVSTPNAKGLISNNTISDNTGYGIRLLGSGNNNITLNIITNNKLSGIDLYSNANNNTLSNNTVIGVGIIDWDNGISLYQSSWNKLINNTVSNCGYRGIFLGTDSSFNSLTLNTVKNNNATYGGIVLYNNANSNTIASNTATNNSYGIYLLNADNNIIYNNYFNNTYNAHDNHVNFWNTTKTPGANIIGGSFIAGNYWSDYTGVDNVGGDGIGDTNLPYNSSGQIANGGDYLPLILPSAGSSLPCGSTITSSVLLAADVNCNGTAITIGADNVVLDCQGFKVTSNRTMATYGVKSRGFNNTVVKNCIIQDFGDSIFFFDSKNSEARNNTLSGAYDYGVYAYNARNPLIRDNKIYSNKYGVGIIGDSVNASVKNNAVYLNLQYGIQINSYNATVESNTVYNNTIEGGIKVDGYSGSIVTNNVVYNNSYGIHCLSSSYNNTIYNNRLDSNTVNANDADGRNLWNTTKTPGTNIIGGSFIAGNYWSDYTGQDTVGSDGIGDTNLPYNSSNNISVGGDYLPLVMPVAGVPAPSPPTGGGGGFYTPSETQLRQGYQRTFSSGDRIMISINSTTHYVTISRVQGNIVTTTITSFPIVFNITIGETKKFDLNSDGYYDFLLKLVSMISSKPELFLQKINEPVYVAPTPTPVVPPVISPPTPTPPEERSCFEIGGFLCGNNQVCSGSIETTVEGDCCIGTCKTPIWKTLIIVLIALVIAVAVFLIVWLSIRGYKRKEEIKEEILTGKARAFVLEARSKGYSEQAIEQMLLDKGWTDEDIKNCLKDGVKCKFGRKK